MQQQNKNKNTPFILVMGSVGVVAYIVCCASHALP